MSVAEGMKASPSQTRQGALYLPRTSGKRSRPWDRSSGQRPHFQPETGDNHSGTFPKVAKFLSDGPAQKPSGVDNRSRALLVVIQCRCWRSSSSWGPIHNALPVWASLVQTP